MTSLYHELRKSLDASLENLIQEGLIARNIAEKLPVVLERPRDESHGDFATNAAMVLSKPAGKNPREIAEKIASHLRTDCHVSTVDVVGPGFINLKLNPDAFRSQLKNMVENTDAFARSDVGRGTRIMVEFCSANPTGPIHAGHMRGTIFGDVLCRLLDKAGYDVWREYLINDAGRQIRTLVMSVWLRYRELFGEDVTIPDDAYPGEYVVEIAKALKEKEGDAWRHETDFEVVLKGIRAFCVDAMMQDIKRDLKDLNIASYDVFFSEYDMQQTGLPETIMGELREKGLVYDGILPPPKGKIVDDYEPVELPLFKSSDFGDDTDRPMKNGRGEFTYFGADVAYHTNKLSRGFDKLVNVWGADHGGAVKRLVSAVEAVTGRKGVLDIKLMQMVRFVSNGQPVKMSKRAGNFITLRQILDDVGPDAARFWFVNRKPETQFDFDLQKAIEKNNDNPVFYVQYAHARMCSVFRQRDEMGLGDCALDAVDYSLLTHEKEMALMRHLSVYPLTIEKAAEALEPHRIANYAHDLASLFHAWYDSERFLHADNIPLTQARLALVKAARAVLQDVFDLVGVSAPERM